MEGLDGKNPDLYLETSRVSALIQLRKIVTSQEALQVSLKDVRDGDPANRGVGNAEPDDGPPASGVRTIDHQRDNLPTVIGATLGWNTRVCCHREWRTSEIRHMFRVLKG